MVWASSGSFEPCQDQQVTAAGLLYKPVILTAVRQGESPLKKSQWKGGSNCLPDKDPQPPGVPYFYPRGTQLSTPYSRDRTSASPFLKSDACVL